MRLLYHKKHKCLVVFNYTMKYMGKTNDTFGRLKLQLPVNLQFNPKLMLQVEKQHSYRVIDISFRLHGKIYTERILERYFYGMHGIS